MFTSFIMQAKRDKQAARVASERAQWTGEALRDQRSEFKLRLYQVAAAQGVAFDTYKPS